MNLIKKNAKSALLLALALGITACGNNTDKAKEENKDNAKPEETKTEEKTGEVKDDMPTLTYLNIGATPKRHDEVQDAINSYLYEQQAGYKINTVFYDWGDYQQKLQLAVNTGEDWDLAFTANRAGPYKTLADQGAFLDLNEYMDNKLSEARGLVDDRMIEGVKIDGKIYGMPSAYPGAVAANQFVWGKDWVDKYNIPYQDIENISQLEPWLKKLKDEEGMQHPFGVSSDFTFAMPEAVYTVADGIAVREEGGKLIAYNMYDDQLYKDQIHIMKDYMDKGYISPDAPQLEAGQKSTGENVLVTEGEGEPGSTAIWSNGDRGEVVSNIIGKSIVIDNGKATGKMASVNSQSTKKDQALDFINRMMTDKKLQDLLSYGVEGEDYELVDGKVKRLNVDNPDKEVYDVAAFQYLSMFNRTPMTGGPGLGDPDFDKEVKDFENKLVASPVLGFNVDRTPIEGELENIQSTVDEYTKNLKTGAFDESYYESFLEQLKVAGIEKAIEEVQKQLDAWNK